MTDDDNTETSTTPDATAVTGKESINLSQMNTVLIPDDVPKEQAEIRYRCGSNMEADGMNDVLTGLKRLTALEEQKDNTNVVVLDNDYQFIYVGNGAIKDYEGSILNIASVPDN